MQTSLELATVSRNSLSNPSSAYIGCGAGVIGVWFGLQPVVFASQAFCISVLDSFLFLENKCVVVNEKRRRNVPAKEYSVKKLNVRIFLRRKSSNNGVNNQEKQK